MSEATYETSPRLRPVERALAANGCLRRRPVASLVAAIEQGELAESAIARLGIDRTTGARRILQGLLHSP